MSSVIFNNRAHFTKFLGAFICLFLIVSCEKDPDPEPAPSHEPAFANHEITVNGVTFTMIAVEHGCFIKGEKASSQYYKTPVVLTKDFYLGACEVTQELWKAVMGDNMPSHFKGDSLPVDSLTYEQCQTFLDKLNALTGKRFRLPTQCEWEYAARGGALHEPYTYSGSDNIDEVGWYKANSGGTTHPVAQKKPNGLGLYDMTGNVFEWCADAFSLVSDPLYKKDTVYDPETYFDSDFCWVHRGGGYSSKKEEITVSDEWGDFPNTAETGYGLRLALSR